MPYKLPVLVCWVCLEPYQPQRPGQKIHATCYQKLRKQRAAEDAAASRITVTREPEPPKEDPRKWVEEWARDGSWPELLGPEEFVPASPGKMWPMQARSQAVYRQLGDGPLKIGVLPDTQCKPGVPLEHLYWAGRYFAEKRCDVIVHLGDHWDMVSLNIYEKGLKKAEGRTYAADVAAGNEGMRLFMDGLREGSKNTVIYDDGLTLQGDLPLPRLVFLMGNHEERILRAIQTDPKLEGTIGYKDLDLAGWEAHQFLEVVEIAGIQFSHYFTSGAKNQPVSSAKALLDARQGSAIQGHNQVYQIAMHPKMGTRAIFAGAFYQHYEEYMGPQGNDHKRHLLVLHQAKDGDFDLMEVSLEFLRKRYAGERKAA
jgi:hypothetical protein